MSGSVSRIPLIEFNNIDVTTVEAITTKSANQFCELNCCVAIKTVY